MASDAYHILYMDRLLGLLGLCLSLSTFDNPRGLHPDAIDIEGMK
jgi:hypothetical protein